MEGSRQPIHDDHHGRRSRAWLGASLGLLLALAGCRAPSGCGRDETVAATEARQCFEAYLAAAAEDRAVERFVSTAEQLSRLGRPGFARLPELLATLEPRVLEAGSGPDWQRNAAFHAVDLVKRRSAEAIPALLEQTRAESGLVRAWTYCLLMWQKEKSSDAAIREAFLRGLTDPYAVVRQFAVSALALERERSPEVLERLEKMCAAIPDAETLECAACAMGELGDRRAVPFLRRAYRDGRSTRLKALATIALAKLADWDFTPEFQRLAREERPHPEAEWREPVTAARWALARKEGCDYPDCGMGMDLAEAWWRLRGCELHGAGQAPRVEFGRPAGGLTLGLLPAAHEWPAGQERLECHVVLKNVSGRPLRIDLRIPSVRLRPAFGVHLEATSPGRQVRAVPESSGSFGILGLDLPPDGIAAVRGTIFDSDFEPRLQPGDRFTVTLEYSAADAEEGTWKGKATSAPITVRIVAGKPASKIP